MLLNQIRANGSRVSDVVALERWRRDGCSWPTRVAGASLPQRMKLAGQTALHQTGHRANRGSWQQAKNSVVLRQWRAAAGGSHGLHDRAGNRRIDTVRTVAPPAREFTLNKERINQLRNPSG